MSAVPDGPAGGKPMPGAASPPAEDENSESATGRGDWDKVRNDCCIGESESLLVDVYVYFAENTFPPGKGSRRERRTKSDPATFVLGQTATGG